MDVSLSAVGLQWEKMRRGLYDDKETQLMHS